MQKHYNSHDSLKHYWIVVLLSDYSGVGVVYITLVRCHIRAMQKDCVAIEEPDCEEDNLEDKYGQRVDKERIMGETTKDWDS